MCLGPAHPRVGEILWGYGHVLRQMKRKREAKEMKKRALAIHRRSQRENLLHNTIDWALLVDKKR